MALRLVLQMEAIRYHPYFQDPKYPYLSPPNLGKIDHLNFSELPPTAMGYYLTNEAADGIIPKSLKLDIMLERANQEDSSGYNSQGESSRTLENLTPGGQMLQFHE